MTKYRAQPTIVDGIRFHSKGEARRYQELRLLERAGEITNLELQPAARQEKPEEAERPPPQRKPAQRPNFDFLPQSSTPRRRTLNRSLGLL